MQLEVVSAQLVHLESFIICERDCKMVSFAPLSRLSQLRHLDMEQVGPPSEVQLQQLCALSQVEVFLLPYATPLQSLLAPGHLLKVADFGPLKHYEQEDCDALSTLPSLTSLVLFGTTCTNVDLCAPCLS